MSNDDYRIGYDKGYNGGYDDGYSTGETDGYNNRNREIDDEDNKFWTKLFNSTKLNKHEEVTEILRGEIYSRLGKIG